MRIAIRLLVAAVVLAAAATPALAADPFVRGGAPAPGTGATAPSRPWNGPVADGVIFVELDEGRVRHKATGFICEAAIGGFARDMLMIYDHAEDGRDVSCRYRIADSWFTVYLTRLPGMEGERVFETYVRQAQDATRVIEAIEAPLAAGSPPLPGHGRFWLSGDETVNGLWMVQIGDWCVKVRATYEQKDAVAIADAAKVAFEQIHAQLEAPEI